jgi:hypothetical protein
MRTKVLASILLISTCAASVAAEAETGLKFGACRANQSGCQPTLTVSMPHITTRGVVPIPPRGTNAALSITTAAVPMILPASETTISKRFA